MAKKSKRQVRRSAQTTSTTQSQTKSAQEFNPDYTHVKTDLKRIGLLAGIFIFLLIALSIAFPYLPIG
ncbi:MAG: hypothetical protein JXA13_12035 [Anaerolineales bacterium]|nr:hypothetical protein [Anaerolineales bacterium]